MEPTKQRKQPLKAVVETKPLDKKDRKEAKVTLKVPRMVPTYIVDLPNNTHSL